MPDILTPNQRHLNMTHIHSTSTKPEMKLRHVLWRLGFRYRMNDRRLPGSPDIVLPKYHTVIFVHGCFWHGHEGCRNYTVPKTNTEFWTAKVDRNRERDQETWRQLEAKGWAVIVVWECELKKTVLDTTISRVQADIYTNGDTHRLAVEERRQACEAYRQERRKHKEYENALKAEIRAKYIK